jgi:hypothetical protein
MRHLAYTEIKDHTILSSLSNAIPKVVYFLTTIFGSIYHDRKHLVGSIPMHFRHYLKYLVNIPLSQGTPDFFRITIITITLNEGYGYLLTDNRRRVFFAINLP